MFTLRALRLRPAPARRPACPRAPRPRPPNGPRPPPTNLTRLFSPVLFPVLTRPTATASRRPAGPHYGALPERRQASPLRRGGAHLKVVHDGEADEADVVHPPFCPSPFAFRLSSALPALASPPTSINARGNSREFAAVALMGRAGGAARARDCLKCAAAPVVVPLLIAYSAALLGYCSWGAPGPENATKSSVSVPIPCSRAPRRRPRALSDSAPAHIQRRAAETRGVRHSRGKPTATVRLRLRLRPRNKAPSARSLYARPRARSTEPSLHFARVHQAETEPASPLGRFGVGVSYRARRRSSGCGGTPYEFLRESNRSRANLFLRQQTPADIPLVLENQTVSDSSEREYLSGPQAVLVFASPRRADSEEAVAAASPLEAQANNSGPCPYCFRRTEQ
ncbi:hypothetical protein B0H17DRAFT_1175788 [Mycena rosella]|uniref:Uncharacterized protein n=1 Tax=Mycena rosella TaxID=1033263 RepID=A0AAD7E178_MYCRO|nr:hypothetical protein B0H17DRAFT_1175788 [Mycena rosella]